MELPVSEKTLLFGEPSPCNPEAENDLQPLIGFGALKADLLESLLLRRRVFFTGTGSYGLPQGT